jgi:hypothetical protein
MRILGVLACLAALVVGAIGIHQRSDQSSAARALESMDAVTASGLERAADGAKVIVEGRVVDGDLVAAPLSDRQLAFWVVERTLHQEVESQDCSGGSCRSQTRQVLSELGTESGGTLAVRVGGAAGVVATAVVPNDPKATVALPKTGSAKEEDPSGGTGWVEAHESGVEPGDLVTLAGERHGERDAPTIHKVEHVALVHGGSRESAIARVSAGERAADRTIFGAALGLAAGIVLFGVGRRRARARRAELERRRAIDAEREAARVSAAADDPAPEPEPVGTAGPDPDATG